MKNVLRAGLLFVALSGMTGLSFADENVTETRQVDARVVRVMSEGFVNLTVRQGSVPGLTIVADKRFISRITTDQSGDTLHLESGMRGPKSGPNTVNVSNMHVELVLPALREMRSEGFGMTEISGFKGERLDLSLDGAGSMKVKGEYRYVSANLGGVGSMNLTLINNDTTSLDLNGAGVITVAGRSRSLNANLGGLGGLDARQMEADAVDLEMSGLGNATVTALRNINLNMSGLGSVNVYGKPLNRKVSVDGLGKVNWK